MAQTQTLKCPESVENLKDKQALSINELLCVNVWRELSHSQRTLIKFLQHLKSVHARRTIKMFVDREAKNFKITTYRSTFEIIDGKIIFKRINAWGEVVIDIAPVGLEKTDLLIEFLSNWVESHLFDKEVVIPKYILDHLA